MIEDGSNPAERSSMRRGRVLGIIGGVLLLGGGAVAGAVAMQSARPAVSMAPAVPTPIRGLSDGIVTVRARVVELFGNKLIVQDASGRALIDLGRGGENGTPARVGEAVTVQGRFEHGFVHAAFIVGSDNKVRSLAPLTGPPHDRGAGPRERCGSAAPVENRPDGRRPGSPTA